MRHATAARAFFTFGAGVAMALLVHTLADLAVPLTVAFALAVGSVLFAATFHVQRPVTAGD